MTLDTVLRETVREVVREVIREELRAQGQVTPGERLTYRKAAELISMSASTIRKWVHAGMLKKFGEGRGARVERAEVLRVHGGYTRPRLVAPEEKAAELLARGARRAR